jgi:hypothetical protein
MALHAMRSARMQNRPWHVRTFVGEHGLDLGGLFNSSLTEAIEAAMADSSVSPHPLFIPSPNSRHGTGSDQDKLVPNPSAVSPLHLAMFRFFGQLLGVTVRLSFPVDVRLPSLFWKAVVGESVTLQDLDRVDKAFVDALRSLDKQHCDGSACQGVVAVPGAGGVVEDAAGGAVRGEGQAWAGAGAGVGAGASTVPLAAPGGGSTREDPSLFHVITRSDGSVRELVPGGALRPVPRTPAGIASYVRAAAAARLQVRAPCVPLGWLCQ